ncbi:MAG: DUF1415 family protein [Polyangiales bacterium]
MHAALLHGTVLAMVDREALREQAVRVHLRYVREVVVAFGYCPWAHGALEGGRVRSAVLFGSEPALDATLAEIVALELDADVDIGFLLFPESTLGPLEHQHFAAQVRASYDPPGASRSEGFAVADFHPDVTADLRSPERLVPFIRASPDPSLQLVRHSALAAVRRGDTQGTRFVDAAALAAQLLHHEGAATPPLHERIASMNLETTSRIGVERVTAVLRDIARDRDQAYAALGISAPPWRRAG